MISRKEALEMLGEETVQRYTEEHRKQYSDKGVNREWDDYVSLPFLKNKLDVDTDRINKEAVITVHPGWGSYIEGSKETAEYDREKHGDYEKEYLEPLLQRLNEAKKETVIVYTPEKHLDKTINFVGDNVLFVPTFWVADICENIFGATSKEFYHFLENSGVEEIELCGEWVGGCFDSLKRKILRYNQFSPKPFKLEEGIKFPVRGKYENRILFSMTKEEDEEMQRTYEKVCKKLDETYNDYLLKLGLEENTCSSKLLRAVVDAFSDTYIYPLSVLLACKEHDKDEIRDSIEFFQEKEILRIEKAADYLPSGLDARLEYGALHNFELLNRIAKEEIDFETDEIIIPLIKTEI